MTRFGTRNTMSHKKRSIPKHYSSKSRCACCVLDPPMAPIKGSNSLGNWGQKLRNNDLHIWREPTAKCQTFSQAQGKPDPVTPPPAGSKNSPRTPGLTPALAPATKTPTSFVVKNGVCVAEFAFLCCCCFVCFCFAFLGCYVSSFFFGLSEPTEAVLEDKFANPGRVPRCAMVKSPYLSGSGHRCVVKKDEAQNKATREKKGDHV